MCKSTISAILLSKIIIPVSSAYANRLSGMGILLSIVIVVDMCSRFVVTGLDDA